MASRTSLRMRLALGLALLACIGVTMQFAVFGRIAERMRDDVAKRNQGLAHALAGEVSNAIAQPTFALSALSVQLEEGLEGQDLVDTLESIRHFTKVVELVQVLGVDGLVRAVAPANSDQLGLDLSNQPFFRMARERRGQVFSESFVSAQTSVATATISEGYSQGVAVMQLRVEEISRMAMVLPPEGGGFVAVVDNKGVVIGHSDPATALRRESLLNLEAVRKGLSGEEGSFQGVYDSIPGIASVSPVTETGWLVLVFEPAANAYASVRNLYSYTLGGVAVVALCSVLAMLAFQAQLLRPLGDLTAQTRAVSRGRYDLDIKPAFREFEPLAESFLTMADALKAREQALDQSRRRLSSVVEAMPSFLAATDGEGCVELWNVEAEKLTGVKAQEALGRPLEEAVAPLVMVLPALEQSAILGLPVKWEKLTLDFGFGRRIVDVLVYPLRHGRAGEEGAEGGAVLRIDDVTDRIRMEEVMVHTEKMMTVGGLAAGMAHEINNPLGGIIMSAQNMARRLSPDLPANQRAAEAAGIDLKAMSVYLEARGIFEQVEAIRELGARAGKIVSNMLGFSRRSHSGYIPVKIDELVDRALELAANDYELKKRLDFKTVAVERVYDPDLAEIPVNRSQIEQVLLNLFKNAAQAMSETAATRTPKLLITTRCEGDDAVLEVRDNGPGIPEEVRERIFEPFFTTKEVGQGTGLGLSVSYYIVTTMHKGSIRVDSTPGEGAVFTVMLPLRRHPVQDGSHHICPGSSPEQAS
ncbi:PAS domain-containing sensor histidine kinase [Fundidesulfovibrio putealis]|uniref:PAS domain-containing sensor histidine kinase n=1 Tax=Fundidesulfovibrio putealis TaxID=270496 RepID=UPI0004214727|nr:PAS domain-containing sensor histidine kinase [Fundidesulfovibrio putealis]